MKAVAELRLREDPARRVELLSDQPLTIGRATNNLLVFKTHQTVSDHHAVVRFSQAHGWLVCDWKSVDGTYLEGELIRRCRPLHEGDEIRLGKQGPVLVFSLLTPAPEQTVRPLPPPRGAQASAVRGRIDIGGEVVRPDQILSAMVKSEPHHPHVFSWWLLLCLGGLLLLPFPLVFWPFELSALGCWIVLGSRKSHTLVVVLHNGQALRRRFANRVTALAHRNGIRRAIGQSQETL